MRIVFYDSREENLVYKHYKPKVKMGKFLIPQFYTPSPDPFVSGSNRLGLVLFCSLLFRHDPPLPPRSLFYHNLPHNKQ